MPKMACYFLNVHPKLLSMVNGHGKIFERVLHANSVPTNRIVIEINEGLVEHDKQLSEAIDNYRERGYKIAIDHFGGRASHLDRLWKYQLDFIKFDVSLIQQAEHNDRLRKTLRHLIQAANDLGAKPIVQGIESQSQLNIAIESGATLLQGYFLGKPVHAKELQPTKVLNSKILLILAK